MFLPNYGAYVCELPENEYQIINQRTHAFEKLKDIFKEIAKS